MVTGLVGVLRSNSDDCKVILFQFLTLSAAPAKDKGVPHIDTVALFEQASAHGTQAPH